jgi:uncharacterized membrane protein YfcA
LLVIAMNSAVALGTRITTTSIDWAITIPFTIAAAPGVLAGGQIANRLDADCSVHLFSVLLIVVAIDTAIRSTTGLH